MFLVPIICGCAFFTESRYRYFIRRLRSTSFRLTHSYRYFTFQVRECSLSSTKIVQTRAMKVYFQIAECSLSSTKIVQTRAKKACLLFAECSLSSTKISILLKLYHLFIEKIWHFYYQKVIFKNKNNLFLL